jgi:hypothetical protein
MTDHHIYEAVAARRNNFDTLVWQVPALSLTAQAFLFTIALGSDSSRPARIISSVLGIIIVFLCITLMARHRQAEFTDAHWLQDYEERMGIPPAQRAHGQAWRDRRDETKVADGLWNVVPLLRGYEVWVVGLGLFGVASVIILVLSVVNPDVLSAAGTDPAPPAPAHHHHR